MPVDLLSRRSMTDMVNTIVPTRQFILDLVYKNRKQHFTDVIDIPVKKTKRKLAKVSRKEAPAGVVVKGDAEIKTIRVPHIREKMQSTAANALNLAAEGGIYATESQKKAYELDVAENVSMLKDRAVTAMEYMACQSLGGSVTMTGKDISVTVDFGFDSTHLPVKSGTACWNSTAPNINADMDAHRAVIQKDYGVFPTLCIMGATAASAFKNDAAVMKALDNQNYKIGTLNLDTDSNYIGRYKNMDIYEYQQTYVDDNDAVQDMYSPHAVTYIAPSPDFVRHFAAVVDVQGGFMPVEFFSKSWIEEDPSVTWVLVETNPVTAVQNPNAILQAIVTT